MNALQLDNNHLGVPMAFDLINTIDSIRNAKKEANYKRLLIERANMLGGSASFVDEFPELKSKLIQPYKIDFKTLEQIDSVGPGKLAELTGLSMFELYEKLILETSGDFIFTDADTTSSVRDTLNWRDKSDAQFKYGVRDFTNLKSKKMGEFLSKSSGVEVTKMDDVRFTDFFVYDQRHSDIGLLYLVRNKYGEPVTLKPVYFESDVALLPQPVKSPLQAKYCMPTAYALDGAYVEIGSVQDGVVGVATNLVTAITINGALKLPMRFTLSHNELENMEFDSTIKQIRIFLNNTDKGPLGYSSFLKLRDRMNKKGIDVKVHWPTRESGFKYWNQVYKAKGLSGLPKINKQ